LERARWPFIRPPVMSELSDSAELRRPYILVHLAPPGAIGRRSKWQDDIRKDMNPEATFDTTVTRDSIWKRFGPNCYLCGFEVFYDQPDLSLRNKSKAWRARWGDVDKYDVNRRAVVEHVIPRRKGGGHTWDNVRIACSRCNLQKGDQAICLSLR